VPTELPDHLQTVNIWLQSLVGWGVVLQTILCPCQFINILYMLKRVGHKLHPCLTLQLSGNNFVCLLTICTAHVLFLYIGYIISYVFSPTPLTSICIADPDVKLSQTLFWNQQSMWRLCFCFVLCVPRIARSGGCGVRCREQCFQLICLIQLGPANNQAKLPKKR
jgi:hypothetical protein